MASICCGLENIIGTKYNDILIGKQGVANTLSGGDGDDVLTGNLDGDFLDGGAGINRADYSSQTGSITIKGNEAYLTSDSTKKDTLKDGAKIYRILLGKELVRKYNETNEFPDDNETIKYITDSIDDIDY